MYSFNFSICQIFTRYHFIPLLQIETKVFEKLGRAFTEGLKVYLPYQTYESRLFLTRRLAGIPGYQYDVDLSKEFYSKQIFTKEELERIKDKLQNSKGFEHYSGIVFGEKIPLININRIKGSKVNTGNGHSEKIKNSNDLFELLELKNESELEVLEIDDEDIENYADHNKLYLLSKSDQFLVKFIIMFEGAQNPLVRKILGFLMTLLLIIMKMFFE